MGTYLVCHHHEPDECRFAFAAWKGFDSPLRKRPTIGSCAQGGHALWWQIEAASEQEALAQLPPYLVERSTVKQVSEVPIP